MISEFISMIGKRSHARPSLFHLEILNIPGLMTSAEGLNDFKRDLKFLCSATDIPGTQILTQDNRIYDLTEKFAYMKAHDDLQVTVRVDKDFHSKKFFDAWEDSVYNRNTGNVFYKSEYTGQIQISPMIEDGSCPYSVQIEDCFPTQIGSIAYSWESTGQIAQFQVTFAFTRKKIVAREALFSPKENAGGKKSNPMGGDTGDAHSFDVMDEERTSTYKDNIYSSVNTAFTENLQQRVAMAASPIDFSTIKSNFRL